MSVVKHALLTVFLFSASAALAQESEPPHDDPPPELPKDSSDSVTGGVTKGVSDAINRVGRTLGDGVKRANDLTEEDDAETVAADEAPAADEALPEPDPEVVEAAEDTAPLETADATEPAPTEAVPAAAEETATETAAAEEEAEEEATEEVDPAKEEAALAAKEEAKRPPPTKDELAQARKHYLRGRSLFESDELESAVREFKQAYRLSRNHLLLYNLGFVNDRLERHDLALFYYERYFWSQAPEDSIREFVTNRIRVLKSKRHEGENALEQEKALSAVASRQGNMEAADRFLHEVIEEVPPKKPVDVTAFVPPWRNWVVKMHYRSSGDAQYRSVEMRPRYNELVGRIPAEKTTDVSLVQYYLEVVDREGRVVERSGRATSPHLVFVDRQAEARFYPDWSEAPALTSPYIAEAAEGPSWGDTNSTRFQVTKWGTTGAAVALVALSASFYAVAADASSTLETEAFAAADELCVGGPPCRSFSGRQHALQTRGRRFERAAHIALGAGIVSAAAASALWIWELSSDDEQETKTVPVVSDNFVGAATVWGF